MRFNTPLMHTICAADPQSQVLGDGLGVSLSAHEIIVEVRTVMDALKELRVDGLAIAMDNSPAWVLADLAALESDCWTLPLPPFFNDEQRANALAKSGCQFVLSDQPLEGCRVLCNLRLASKQLYLHGVGGQLQVGSTLPGSAKVTFTSGSTGEPSGLCLSKEQLFQTASVVAEKIKPLKVETHVSVLPLAVLLENVAGVYAALLAGVPCIVPSLYTTGLAGQPSSPGPQLLEFLSSYANHSCIVMPELLKALCVSCTISETNEAFRPRFIAVGGAKIGQGLLQQAADAGLPVYEGYGLSEACSVLALNLPGATRVGSVGRLLGHQDVELAEDGELLLKHPGFLGFCGETQPVSGTFATGDIGEFDQEGYLHITGRKKNTLITGMGRNVSPEWIESELGAEAVVSQVMVHCANDDYLRALVVGHPDDHQIDAAVERANRRLPSYARVQEWTRVAAFTPTDGTLTGNGKLQRQRILALRAA